MSIERQMDKEDVVHIYSGMLAIKKNEMMPFAATCVDLESIILSQVNQTEKDKHCMMPLTCGILKSDTDELIYRTETDS